MSPLCSMIFGPHLVFAFVLFVAAFMLRMAYILPFNKPYSLVIGTILTLRLGTLYIFKFLS